MKRFTPSSPEIFNYGIAAKIIAEEFPSLKDKVAQENQVLDEGYGLDGETAAEELGFQYHSFRDTVRDLITQALSMA